jgi:hypothetical protein
VNTKSTINARHLSLTLRGKEWLGRFEDIDRELAERVLSALTLVSHSEFERTLTAKIIDFATQIDGPVALFATREVKPSEPYFNESDDPINAVAPGSDLGSEARVAALIRNLSRTSSGKLLNHPSVGDMRKAKCRAIFTVDDFIGSGKRTADFLSSMWMNLSLRSWHSLGLISFWAVTYAATEVGLHKVENSRTGAKVRYARDCPAFRNMPWRKNVLEAALDLFRRYGKRTSKKSMALGYKKVATAIVFEHGCPNNSPAIFWAPSHAKSDWEPLFPQRSVLPTEASAFPPEIARREPTLVMLQAGQRRLSRSGALTRRGPIGTTILTVLGLAAQGIRSRAAIAYATGLAAGNITRILDRCVKWDFLTATLRLTPAGSAELRYAKSIEAIKNRVPPRGNDDYYPVQLRGSVDG